VGRIVRIVQRKPPVRKFWLCFKKAAQIPVRFTISIGFNRIKACCTDVKYRAKTKIIQDILLKTH
jgi:hypothetical protein